MNNKTNEELQNLVGQATAGDKKALEYSKLNGCLANMCFL